jgi:hypothetical protein
VLEFGGAQQPADTARRLGRSPVRLARARFWGKLRRSINRSIGLNGLTKRTLCKMKPCTALLWEASR